MQPAKVGTGSSLDREFNGRSNLVHWIPHVADEIVRAIVERISQQVGLPSRHAESIQVVHYNTGQQYTEHVDAFASPDDFDEDNGDRERIKEILRNGECSACRACTVA